MAIATFSVPIDIPWHRIAFSRDMMDKVACDRKLPLRWRSSVAVFEYEPPIDQQQIDGYLVTYLKVACTITGYQPDAKEIRIRERIARSGWAAVDEGLSVNLSDSIEQYHACYGAMLEVVVAPPAGDAVSLADYPYFADFDPKKRELYELVTDTGEVMSRSLDDVGVRLGHTTSQSHEVRDSMSAGVSISAPAAFGGPGATAGIQHSTTDLNQRSTENVRTTDALRENRETLSHTTQLSQMYHQLDSYHLGTNRAAFFVMPRPHVVQSTDPAGTPRTFVDGPRQLEGMQEFMLVVVRPKSQEHICVEAYLETAHLVQTTKLGAPGQQSTSETFAKLDQNEPGAVVAMKSYSDWPTLEIKATRTQRFNPPTAGFVIDTADPRSDAGFGGLHIITETSVGIVNRKIDIQPDFVQVTCEVTYRNTPMLDSSELNQNSSYEMHATIFWKKDSAATTVYGNTLLITGRAVCSCELDVDSKFNELEYEKDLSVVFEKNLKTIDSRPERMGNAMSIHDANRLGKDLHRQILASVSSADRYPRGAVGLLDTQLVSGILAGKLSDAETPNNPPVSKWLGVDKEILRRIATYSPSMTRSQMLAVPLSQQVERFGLSFEEAVDVRRALSDLKEPVGPRPIPKIQKIRVPDVTGLKLEEARAALISGKLRFSGFEVSDSSVPSGVVIGQDPQFETEVDADFKVTLNLSSGLSVCVPDLINLPLSEAMCKLLEAGLKSEPTVVGTAGPNAVVSKSEPLPRSWVMPHSRVTLSMSSQPRTKKEHGK